MPTETIHTERSHHNRKLSRIKPHDPTEGKVKLPVQDAQVALLASLPGTLESFERVREVVAAQEAVRL